MAEEGVAHRQGSGQIVVGAAVVGYTILTYLMWCNTIDTNRQAIEANRHAVEANKISRDNSAAQSGRSWLDGSYAD